MQLSLWPFKRDVMTLQIGSLVRFHHRRDLRATVTRLNSDGESGYLRFDDQPQERRRFLFMTSEVYFHISEIEEITLT
jgi:hypothetical protein